MAGPTLQAGAPSAPSSPSRGSAAAKASRPPGSPRRAITVFRLSGRSTGAPRPPSGQRRRRRSPPTCQLPGGVEAAAVRRPGDAAEVAVVHALGVGREQALERARVEHVDRGRVVVADREPPAVGREGDPEGPLAARRLGRAQEAQPRVVEPDLAVVARGREPARGVERGPVAAGRRSPRPPPPPGPPRGRSGARPAAAERRGEPGPVGREGEVVDDVRQPADPAQQPPARPVEQVDALVGRRSCPSTRRRRPGRRRARSRRRRPCRRRRGRPAGAGCAAACRPRPPRPGPSCRPRR